MNGDRRRVLDLVAAGKITTAEAQRLIDAIETSEFSPGAVPGAVYVERKETVFLPPVEASGDNDGPEEKPPSTREEAFTVGESPKLIVRGFNGRVRVEAGADGVIQMNAKIKRASRVIFEAAQEGDTVTIEAKRKSGGMDLFGRSPGAEITVTTPAATSVDLTTSNGSIELRGIEGSGPVKTSNGRILLENVKGRHDMRTSNGRVEVNGMEGDGEVRNTNGSIKLTNVRGAFQASTTNGSIALRGELARGTACRLESSNGSVYVKLAGEPSLRIDARTSNGRVRSELPASNVTSQERNHLVATIGVGDGELFIRTSNGSVLIE